MLFGAPDSIVDAHFHTLSDGHVVTLSADTLRLFDLASSVEEAAVEIPMHRHPLPVSLAFGGARGFDRFAIHVGRQDGSIVTVCPVVPAGAAIRLAEWEELVEDVQEQIDSLETQHDDAGEEEQQLVLQLEWLRSCWQAPSDEQFGPGAMDSDWVVFEPTEADSMPLSRCQHSKVGPTSGAAEESSRQLLSLSTVPALATPITVVVRLFEGGKLDVLASVCPVQARFGPVDEDGTADVHWTVLEVVDTTLVSPAVRLGSLEVDPVVGHIMYFVHSSGMYVGVAVHCGSRLRLRFLMCVARCAVLLWT